MKIFQTYSGPSQRSLLSPNAIPYDYTDNGGTEYEVFKELYKTQRYLEEPWGALSWKFEIKSHIEFLHFQSAAQSAFDSGADCVFINPMYGADAVFSSVWEQGVAYGHHGLEKIASFLLARGYLVSEDFSLTNKYFSLCNYFVARNCFWDGYFSFVDAALDDLSAEAKAGSEIGHIYEGPSNYSKNPTLTMRPFIVERLLSGFLAKKSFAVSSIEVGLEVHKAKFGCLLGNSLYRLSTIKKRLALENRADLRNMWTAAARGIRSGGTIHALMYLDDPEVSLVELCQSMNSIA